MAARLVRLSCPSCGGTLDVSTQEAGSPVVCTYCGSTFTRTEPPAPAGTGAGPARGAGRGGAVVLAWIAGLVLMGGGVAAYVALQPSTQTASPALSASPARPASSARLFDGTMYLAATAAGPAPAHDLFLFAEDAEDRDRGYRLHRVDGPDRAVRWSSAPLGDDVDWRYLTMHGDRAFVPSGTRLTALHLADGRTAWEATLSADVPVACAGCLRVAGGRLLVLQKNDRVQAFDVDAGTLAWSQRQPSARRRLDVAGRWLAVPDGRTTTVALYDLATGRLAHTLDLARGERHRRLVEGWPGPEGRLYYVLMARGPDHWLQAWTLDGGTLASERPLGPLRFRSEGPRLLEGGTLYLAQDSVLYALDLATGGPRPLLTDPEQVFRPLLVAGDALVVLATPSWDRNRWALWGLDRATGATRWQFVPEAKSRRPPGKGAWDVHRTPEGLAVVQCLQNADEDIRYDLLDPATGVSKVRRVLFSGTRHLWQVHWAEDTLWLRQGADLVAVDTRTGALRYRMR